MLKTNSNTSCPMAAALLLVETNNRQKAKTTLNQKEAARLANLALKAQRSRYRHMDTCATCGSVEAAA